MLAIPIKIDTGLPAHVHMHIVNSAHKEGEFDRALKKVNCLGFAWLGEGIKHKMQDLDNNE